MYVVVGWKSPASSCSAVCIVRLNPWVSEANCCLNWLGRWLCGVERGVLEAFLTGHLTSRSSKMRVHERSQAKRGREQADTLLDSSGFNLRCP